MMMMMMMMASVKLRSHLVYIFKIWLCVFIWLGWLVCQFDVYNIENCSIEAILIIFSHDHGTSWFIRGKPMFEFVSASSLRYVRTLTQNLLDCIQLTRSYYARRTWINHSNEIMEMWIEAIEKRSCDRETISNTHISLHKSYSAHYINWKTLAVIAVCVLFFFSLSFIRSIGRSYVRSFIWALRCSFNWFGFKRIAFRS